MSGNFESAAPPWPTLASSHGIERVIAGTETRFVGYTLTKVTEGVN